MFPSEAPRRVTADQRVAIEAEIAALDRRLAQLERAMREQRWAPDERIAVATGSVSALRETRSSDDPGAAVLLSALDNSEPTERIAGLAADLAAREQRLAEVEAAAREQIAGLSAALSAIEESTIWRATAPLRSAAASLPQPVRLALRRVARGIYWALTPQRMLARLRWFSYAPLLGKTVKRLESLSAEARGRLGMPLRRSYGSTAVEQLDIYPTAPPNAPVFVFIHGGAWREGEATNYGFPAEMFVNAGAHFIALDFIGIKECGGDLRVMAQQVRRGIAWVYRNAASFGGDCDRIYVGGHSSGGHLCGVALVTDWQKDFGLPADMVKGGLLMSGVFDMKPVRRSKGRSYIRFTDESEEAMSTRRHIELLRAPVVITCGSDETPEFQQQSRDFCAAVKEAGKPAELIEPANFGHMEMLESLGNPFGPNGRAALSLMKLSLNWPNKCAAGADSDDRS